MKINKFLHNAVIFAVVVFLSLSFFYYFYVNKYFLASNNQGSTNTNNAVSCVSKIEERVVRGISLSGLVEPGQIVKILFGFYDCNEIKRGDIVAYSYAGNPEPIIKIVKGVSGDNFHMEKTTNGWHILINEEILKNSQNNPYILNEKRHKMLALYEKDYQGIVPQNAYLILGNMVGGTLDSSVIGFVNKSDMVGKVLRELKGSGTFDFELK